VQTYAEELIAKPAGALAPVRHTVTLGGMSFEDGMRLEPVTATTLADTWNFAEGIGALRDGLHGERIRSNKSLLLPIEGRVAAEVNDFDCLPGTIDAPGSRESRRNPEKIGMTRTIYWKWESDDFPLGMDEPGDGPSVVVLPALSSISTREEMLPLSDRLSSSFHVATIDWPGFGDRERPFEDWSPDVLTMFLNWLLSEIVLLRDTIVAAGHAATYALYQAVSSRGTIGRLVLISPTWRGQLPTMRGGERPFFALIRAAIDHRVISPLLYRLNVNRLVVSKMARGHLYNDPSWLTGDRLLANVAVARARGARDGSVRFVTGALDRVGNRAAFPNLAKRTNVPILVIHGDDTPPKSRAEMEALADLPNVKVTRLPIGKLAIQKSCRKPSLAL
jgi:pimeloyl-ACP methyl ester carboxylesterase